MGPAEVLVSSIQIFLFLATVVFYYLLKKVLEEARAVIEPYLKCRCSALKVSKETTERLQEDFKKAIVNDNRYLQDVSKGGKTVPPPPKVDPEDKLRIAKGDDWRRE